MLEIRRNTVLERKTKLSAQTLHTLRETRPTTMTYNKKTENRDNRFQTTRTRQKEHTMVETTIK